MNNDLACKCILSGILAGNDTLERWTGGEWVCQRGSAEYLLVFGVADRFIADMPVGWHVWPETKTGVDFKDSGMNYRNHIPDWQNLFGGVRYDLGLLRPAGTISGLVEIKRYWIKKHVEEKGDLPKLARALSYLGKKPLKAQNNVKEGVLLESVFFGAFIWHVPTGKYANKPLEAQYRETEDEVRSWWQGATAGGGDLIQVKILFAPPKTGAGEKARWEAGAVCVSLSLNEDP